MALFGAKEFSLEKGMRQVRFDSSEEGAWTSQRAGHVFANFKICEDSTKEMFLVYQQMSEEVDSAPLERRSSEQSHRA